MPLSIKLFGKKYIFGDEPKYILDWNDKYYIIPHNELYKFKERYIYPLSLQEKLTIKYGKLEEGYKIKKNELINMFGN